jgi:hypothetical protein
MCVAFSPPTHARKTEPRLAGWGARVELRVDEKCDSCGQKDQTGVFTAELPCRGYLTSLTILFIKHYSYNIILFNPIPVA